MAGMHKLLTTADWWLEPGERSLEKGKYLRKENVPRTLVKTTDGACIADIHAYQDQLRYQGQCSGLSCNEDFLNSIRLKRRRTHQNYISRLTPTCTYKVDMQN